MSDGILFLRVAADRIGAPGPDRIVGKMPFRRHQCGHLVPNHPDRREDGRHSKANCTSSGFESHLMGWGGSIWGNFGEDRGCLQPGQQERDQPVRHAEQGEDRPPDDQASFRRPEEGRPPGHVAGSRQGPRRPARGLHAAGHPGRAAGHGVSTSPTGCPASRPWKGARRTPTARFCSTSRKIGRGSNGTCGTGCSFSSTTNDPVGIEQAVAKAGRMLEGLGLKPVKDLTDGPEVWTWGPRPGWREGGTLLVAHLDAPIDAAVAAQSYRRDPEWVYGEGYRHVSRATGSHGVYPAGRCAGCGSSSRTPLAVLLYTDEGRSALHSGAAHPRSRSAGQARDRPQPGPEHQRPRDEPARLATLQSLRRGRAAAPGPTLQASTRSALGPGTSSTR